MEISTNKSITGDGYQAKINENITKSEIDRFLSSADDKEFLMIKVRLLLLLGWINSGLPELVELMN
ncbi:hypothetical protein NQ317_016392 [Molorchus minor]|uniref:Uncharacterized protein n=1 Tax=Molorchus minor TaxID=1323400 RepID=A0ABQ9JJ44_9CUCU|nr:hypothetical protein NQ317_016392 [Molorchus minor]